MCAVLVFGSVRGVGEGLVAALVLAHVGLLPDVGAQVGLQVLQAGVRLGTALKLHTQAGRERDRKSNTGRERNSNESNQI